jgi:hypothetical protein
MGTARPRSRLAQRFCAAKAAEHSTGTGGVAVREFEGLAVAEIGNRHKAPAASKAVTFIGFS